MIKKLIEGKNGKYSSKRFVFIISSTRSAIITGSLRPILENKIRI